MRAESSAVVSGRAGVLSQMPLHSHPQNNRIPFPSKRAVLVSSERTVSSSHSYEAWTAILYCDGGATAKSEG